MMKDLVETLEAQHRSLEQFASALNAALKAGALDQAQGELKKLCALLESHVKLEDAQFYPALVAGAKVAAAPHVAAAAEMFQQNMHLIADGLSRFCTRWENGIQDVPTFVKEWKGTLEILGKRMGEEERTLHPMYRKHAAALEA